MRLEKYYEDPQTLHVGKEENRAYFIPYRERMGDATIGLSGTDWKFYWYKNPLEVPEEFIDGIDTDYDEIPVPSCVNVLGYEKHQYANVKMPIPFDPPYVPLENPCGAYVKKFPIESLEELYYLNFEGVDSCYYIWINGKFVGYNQVSHSTGEFHVTEFLKVGENTLCVLVLKWCDGTYFEDQDKFRMTGIFRDVYLLRRPKVHICDYTIKTKVGETSTITVRTEWSGNAQEVNYSLIAPCGTVIEESNLEKSVVEFQVTDAKLWNAETPYLYTLIMQAGGETIQQKVGIRQIEIRDAIIYLNGQNIKFKGTNRHDSNALTGYTISREQLLHDLKLMKEHNMNAIRTSHYPNAPWAYELYSELGFYVIDEADIETHNTEHIYAGGRSNYNYEDEIISSTSFGLLCSDPTYEKTILDRVQRCVIRDKNQACVVMWSLGNEAGYGINMEKAAAWVKQEDPAYFVHYEGSIYQMLDHENDLSNIDIYSRMYMPPKESAMYCEQGAKKPLVLCEYISSMGNGPGDIEDYFEVFYEYDNCAGGFVWEWNDHCVYDGKTVDGKDKYLYGGDFGEFPNDGNFCVDGMIDPSRTPSTGLIEYKNVARPIRATMEEGQFILFNTMDFLNSRECLDIHWSYVVDDKIVQEGILADFNVAPHEKKICPIPYKKVEDNQKDAYLMLQYFTNCETPLLPSGSLMGFDQILLVREDVRFEPKMQTGLHHLETERYIEVRGSKFRCKFDKFTGMMDEFIADQKIYFLRPMEYNIWRAPMDDDNKILQEWLNAGYDRKTVRVYESKVQESEEASGSIEVIFQVGIGAIFLQNVLHVTSIFRIFGDGSIQLLMEGRKDPVFPYLPRFGVRMFLPKDFTEVEYRGYGPFESYIDKRRASYYGRFQTTVDSMHEDYIKPQENGSHYGCKYIKISNEDSELAVFGESFSFNASRYTQEELGSKRHNYELEKSNYVTLCIDSHMSGVGSGSCGPHLIEKYRVDGEKLVFDVMLRIPF